MRVAGLLIAPARSFCRELSARRFRLGLAAGFILGLGVMEGAVRWLGLDRPAAEPAAVYHASWGRWHRADFTFEYPSATARPRHPVQFNQHGMRDSRPVAVARPADVYRVALLGDSYVEAVHVPESAGIARRLEECLRQRSGRSVEVLNFACSGYSTAAELAQLREFVLTFSPQLVICFHHFTDITEDWAFARRRDRPRRLGVIERQVAAVLDCSRLARLLRGKLRGSGLPAPAADGSLQETPDAILHEPYTAADEQAWACSLGYLGGMAELLRRRQIWFVVVLVPIVSQVEPPPATVAAALGFRYLGNGHRLEHRGYQERVAAYCQQHHIPCLDLLDFFRNANPEGRPMLFLPHELHWSAAGHDLAARVVADFLSASACLSSGFAAPASGS